MTIEQARYIVEVAHRGTIQQAAKELFVSQSAISQSISAMEKDLGLQIFNRTRNGCELTSFGKEIYKLCLQIVSNVDTIEMLPLSKTSLKKGRIFIGMSNYGLYAYIAQVAAMFHKTHPNVDVIINELDYPQMIQQIDDGTCDFGVAITLESTFNDLVQKYNCHIFAESYLSIGISKQNELYELYNEAALTPIQLANKAWVFSNISFAEAFGEIMKYSHQDVLFYSNNITLITSAISRNLAVGVFTDLMPQYNRVLFGDTIATLPLVIDGRRPYSYFTSIAPKNKGLSDVSQPFFELWTTYARFSPLSL